MYNLKQLFMEEKVKKLINLRDSFKIITVYFIIIVVSIKVTNLVVKYEYIKSYLKNYFWVLSIFTILFLILIRLFKVKYKSVLIFLGVIIFLLLFVLINLDLFISRWSTPNEIIFPIISIVAIYTTLPFQSVINTLVGYDLGNLSYIILPIYMLLLALLSYITLNFKAKNYNK